MPSVAFIFEVNYLALGVYSINFQKNGQVFEESGPNIKWDYTNKN